MTSPDQCSNCAGRGYTGSTLVEDRLGQQIRECYACRGQGMTNKNTTTDNETDAERRIRSAASRMPYGGMVHCYGLGFGHLAEPVTMELIADYMEKLRDVLEDASKSARTTRVELRQMKQDLAGFRRLIGSSSEEA